jgi:ribonuclease P protein component
MVMLPQKKRLRRSREFKETFTRGKKVFGKFMIGFFIPNSGEDNRFGIVASKKVGNAVKRNRARRRYREIIRKADEHLHQGYDVVIVVKKVATEAGFNDMAEDFRRVTKKAGLC